MKKVLLLCILLSSCGKEGEAKALDVLVSPTKMVKLLDYSNLPIEKLSTMGYTEQFFATVSSDIKPIKNDLGMSGVPVLDQGQEGTCLTFATTAAIDARLGIGDFISQQCSLQLNKTLGNDLWSGAYLVSEIFDPLKKYGAVSQSGCNAQYPSRNVPISVAEYQSRADKSVSERVSALKYTYYSQPSLSILKSAINAGKRVEVSFLLNPNSKDGVKGYDITVNGVKKYGGLWSCSNPDKKPEPVSEYERCLQDYPSFKWYCDFVYGGDKFNVSGGENCGRFNAGHGVIAVGYDDDQGLVKIRNSWGTSVGNSGEYYMSFEFFSSQTIDVTVFE